MRKEIAKILEKEGKGTAAEYILAHGSILTQTTVEEIDGTIIDILTVRCDGIWFLHKEDDITIEVIKLSADANYPFDLEKGRVLSFLDQKQASVKPKESDIGTVRIKKEYAHKILNDVFDAVNNM